MSIFLKKYNFRKTFFQIVLQKSHTLYKRGFDFIEIQKFSVNLIFHLN